MDLHTAIDFIRPAIPPAQGIWADIGAGTGIFTQALDHLLEPGSTIYAADKNPHMLYGLHLASSKLIVEELDFNRPYTLPVLDGILMANTLHYAQAPVNVLDQLLEFLKPGGWFVLIEYETSRPLTPWVPYPVPLQKFVQLSAAVSLSEPKELARIPSAYGHDWIYLAQAEKR
ncbi:MAG: class I SAM-dependent methyltransferase [Saprospiraceae bacterium]|nr:class I SAM-dependent methyltransferase [Lewinella sp.]